MTNEQRKLLNRSHYPDVVLKVARAWQLVGLERVRADRRRIPIAERVCESAGTSFYRFKGCGDYRRARGVLYAQLKENAKGIRTNEKISDPQVTTES